jgi:hypothetical protein
MLRGWRGRDPLQCVDQVGNAPDDSVDLTPVSQVPAENVALGWSPLLSGQEPPLIYEQYESEEVEPCRTL